ncbi:MULTISPECIES: RagB/SusD family nutrient uptake outer membrane protein [unclassified Flavobacterium]|uniref:RagB/SusD family nutrient uptake outer membrane protein n=1 Tax=unclassified Flavobacterium TaxID=196869 RepID=UPI0009694FC4|nr:MULTISPECIES: RagB/SusD family nutrient uptake outer membrane protein [unclassified Flavobacterium]MBN9284106.1 RagB/SusD family nutrient uptake outer membrane protein [Flavobacterium sp.]OJV71121.1 MAG: hypothetical protein BGO42_04725 [Flavobacterium sp. 40-81]
MFSDKTKYITIYLGLLSIFFTVSCKKLISVDSPINQLGSDVVYNSDANAISAITGLYSSMSANATSFVGSGTTIFCGLSSDELHNSSSITYDDFFNNTLSSSTSALDLNIWTPAYNYIYQANSIIAGVDHSKTLGSSTRSQVKGEALLIRAFCYFYLVNFFGDVPLVLSTDYQSNAMLVRSPSSKIYEQITEDLQVSQQLLTVTYPGGNRGRINLYTATAFLARVYLYQKDWNNAETQSSSVINSSAYSLVSNPDSVFLSASKEAIWQLIPVPATANTTEGTNFIPGSNTVPNYELTGALLKSFPASDKRKQRWTKTISLAGNSFTYPFKYKARTAAGVAVSEYYVMMRLAEQYLIRAEAKAQKNNLNSAIQDVDKIRQRAGITLLSIITPNISQKALIDSIALERKREFFAEWGHRWFDLKRTDQAHSILGTIKPDWQSTDTLYPIPKPQMLLNSNLVQNPGYN